MAFVLAYMGAGSQAAFGQTTHSPRGIGIALPGLNIPGIVITSPTSLNLNGQGLNTTLPSISAAGLISTTPASASLSRSGLSATLPSANVVGSVSVSSASVNLNSNGLNATLPSANVAGLVSLSSASVTLSSSGLSATLPGANVADLVSLSPASVSLTEKGTAITLPDVDVGGKTLLSGGQIAPITQLFASIGSAEAFAPVEHLLNGLAFGDNASPGCTNAESSALEPLPASSIWAWNAGTFGSTDHDGYRVNAHNGASCGSTLPFQTTQRTVLPGVVWDASTALGLKQGTLHLGLSGGAMETNTQLSPTAALPDAGITQGGAARLRSWSVGGFSLLTADNWYAGSAFGSAWGRTESQNFVLGSDSEYGTSTFVAAGFLGTIVPLTETLRFDVRGTLSHQRTVGEAHADSVGLVYGDHTIEATDATLSGRLFGVFRQDEMTIRPFIQAGVTHHLSYSNQLEIDGIALTLQEADTSVFGAAGLDFEISNTLQLSVGVRHDRSPDLESVTGRFGFSLRLN